MGPFGYRISPGIWRYSRNPIFRFAPSLSLSRRWGSSPCAPFSCYSLHPLSRLPFCGPFMAMDWWCVSRLDSFSLGSLSPLAFYFFVFSDLLGRVHGISVLVGWILQMLSWTSLVFWDEFMRCESPWFQVFQFFLTSQALPPPPNVIFSRFWYAFCMLKLIKFPPPHGGGLTFYYTSHVMNRFIPHVHSARPLNRFENGPNLADNRIEYVLLTTWDGNSIFSSANRARPGLQKLHLHGFTEWDFRRNKEKAYQNGE